MGGAGLVVVGAGGAELAELGGGGRMEMGGAGTLELARRGGKVDEAEGALEVVEGARWKSSREQKSFSHGLIEEPGDKELNLPFFM